MSGHVSGPSAHLCGALFVSGAGASALCRHQGPAIFSAHSLCRVPALFLCQGPALSLSGPRARCQDLCRGPPILRNTLCPGTSDPRATCATHPAPRAHPRATHRAPQGRLPSACTVGPQLPSACHLGPRSRATHPAAPIRVPPIHPGAFPFSRREPQTCIHPDWGVGARWTTAPRMSESIASAEKQIPSVRLTTHHTALESSLMRQ